MADNETRSLRLAVLIDGDNVSPSIAERLFRDVRALGEPIVRRVYGDNLDKWKPAIRKYALEPRLVVPNVGRKNAADFALVIGAMDVLHGGQVGGFCLVSSDSDFTALAIRLTGAGYPVYGFGSKRTPEPLRSALTRFTTIDDEAAARSSPTKQPAKAEPAKKAAPARKAAEPAPATPQPSAENEAEIIEAIGATTHKDGWASLNDLGKVARSRGLKIRHLGEKLRKLASVEVEGTGDATRVRVRPKARRPRRTKKAPA